MNPYPFYNMETKIVQHNIHAAWLEPNSQDTLSNSIADDFSKKTIKRILIKNFVQLSFHSIYPKVLQILYINSQKALVLPFWPTKNFTVLEKL